MSPGVGDCVVWWEAWAAVGALISAFFAIFAVYVAVMAMLATIFLGYMTWKLGKAANKIGESAVVIAKKESQAREDLAVIESTLILIRIQTEVAMVADRAAAIAESLAPTMLANLLNDAESRSIMRTGLALLKLPTVGGLTERLHVLDAPISGCLARALGVCDTLHIEWEDIEGETSHDAIKAVWNALPRRLQLLEFDLNKVRRACITAVQKLNINPPELIAIVAPSSEQE
ncbi:hypothetical protein [Stenotrophomonas acidaminiphila]